jgi:hypothetical protein
VEAGKQETKRAEKKSIETFKSLNPFAILLTNLGEKTKVESRPLTEEKSPLGKLVFRDSSRPQKPSGLP